MKYKQSDLQEELTYFLNPKATAMKAKAHLSSLATATLFLLLICSTPSKAQQIDSVAETVRPFSDSWLPQVDVGFDLFLDNITGVTVIHVKLGTQAGGNELLEESYPIGQVSVQYDSQIQKYRCHIDAGLFPGIPPYISAWLVVQGSGTSSIFTKQLVH